MPRDALKKFVHGKGKHKTLFLMNRAVTDQLRKFGVFFPLNVPGAIMLA